MIDNCFRRLLAKHVRLVILVYRKLKITPNMVSVGALILAGAASLACGYGFDLCAIVLWWLSRFLDGTDGILARSSGQTTPFGAYLDIVCDMAAYSAMVLAFSLRFPGHETLWLIVLALYVLCIASALALGSLQREWNIPHSDNRGLTLGAGLIEGGETGIAYTLLLIFPTIIQPWLYVWLSLLTLTVCCRTVLAYKTLRIEK
jgi:phosphatidylglycerophosphate synthase